jgi:hypothetical protein
MPDVEIRETTITPDVDGSSVRLQISDVPPPYESATMLLDVTVKLPEYTAPPLMVQMQRQAIRAAMEVFRSLDQSLLQEIRKQPHIDAEPRQVRRS